MVFQRRNKRTFWQTTKASAYPEKGWKRPFGYIWLRLKRRPGTPDYIAKGFAIGILISFSPFLGIHFFGAIALAWIFRADAIAAALASLLINAPVSFAVIFPLTYRVGRAVLDLRPRFHNVQIDNYDKLWRKMWPIESWNHFVQIFWELFVPMTIGGLIVGVPVAMACYYFVKKTIQLFKDQRSHLFQKRVKHQFDKTEADIETHIPHAE